MYRVFAFILSKICEQSVMNPLEVVKGDVDRAMRRIVEE